MLTVTEPDIVTGQNAPDKQQAIAMVAEGLVSRGLVKNGYEQGMQQRELQAATYIGNGIAIPHGTVETRNQVVKTGVQVMQFPAGIAWGDEGQKAYVVIGIAAGSDEHLGILKQLTRVLSTPGLEKHLKEASSASVIAKMLNANKGKFTFDQSLIDLNFPAKSLITLKAASVGLLSDQQLVDSTFVTQLISSEPTYLGEGFWLSSGSTGVKQSAMSMVTASTDISYNELPVKALITLASVDDSCTKVLTALSGLMFEKRLTSLLTADASTIISSLVSIQPEVRENVHYFTIMNSHGLHARPSAMLVHAIKGFDASIQVANATENGEFVNGRVVSNVIGLGLAKSHRIAVIAEGVQAAEALAAIEQAITSGLGEALA
ncbi:fused PTS fructose transporter subunit IIA/HPr protein [Sansalvadorimonas verongulae]|uniref:fused PTS fructose transporter subunit IIA/HPr protein n=1 Tax=Sansalvadorimonas verongulae TaxID=2172824 RepID=UPI0012BCA85D|nr:fused PTS fructose transporter subunit IIA/HPr protein [Sansalvadorimonas verongulae]MTI12992.1 HPr family phosphocarrier protein [Sansalvadorimonas verongulae]